MDTTEYNRRRKIINLENQLAILRLENMNHVLSLVKGPKTLLLEYLVQRNELEIEYLELQIKDLMSEKK